MSNHKVEEKKTSARYAKIIEWSEEDQCYIGSCPDLFYAGCQASIAGLRGSLKDSSFKLLIVEDGEVSGTLGPRRRQRAWY